MSGIASEVVDHSLGMARSGAYNRPVRPSYVDRRTICIDLTAASASMKYQTSERPFAPGSAPNQTKSLTRWFLLERVLRHPTEVSGERDPSKVVCRIRELYSIDCLVYNILRM